MRPAPRGPPVDLMTFITIIPLLLFLLIMVGTGAVGLVFIVLFNIGLVFGTYAFTTSDFDIPAQDSAYQLDQLDD